MILYFPKYLELTTFHLGQKGTIVSQRHLFSFVYFYNELIFMHIPQTVQY